MKVQHHAIKTYPMANFQDAEFCASFPVDKPTGVVVITPGSGGDGRHYVRDRFWTEWAAEHNLAIVGVRFTDVNPRIDEDYVQANRGSGLALCQALAAFDLSGLPLYMFGHSAGGGFNYEFACTYPEWVAAFIVNKGGVYYTALAPTKTRAIPSLWFCGLKDADYRVNILAGLHSMNGMVSYGNKSPFNWEWRQASEGHEIGRSEEQSQEFFSKLILKGE